jgi:O-antigen/teichoic acid export membrane protein
MGAVGTAKPVRADLAIARSGILLFGLKMVGCVLGFAMQLILARLLGVSAFGIFATAISAAGLFAIVGSCGLPLTAVRFLPGYVALGHGQLVRGFLKTTGVMSVSGAFIGIAAFLVASQIVRDEGVAFALALAAPLAFVFSLSQTATGLLLALQRPVQSEIPMAVIRPLVVMGLAFGMMTFSASRLNEVSAVLAVIVGTTVALALMIWWLTKAIRPIAMPAASATDLRAWFSSSIVMILLVGGIGLNERLDVMFVAGLANTTDAGIYSVAARFAQLISLAPAAVSARAIPIFAETWSRGDGATLGKAAVLTSRTSFALAVGLGIVMVAGGGMLLGWFGTAFKQGSPALWFLVVGHVTMAAAAAAAPALIASGREWKAAAVLAATLGLNAALNLVLVPVFGMTGAAVATAVSMSATGLCLTLLVRRELGLKLWFANEGGRVARPGQHSS